MKKRTVAVMTALSLTLVLGGCKDNETRDLSDTVATQETVLNASDSPMTEFIFRSTGRNYHVVFSDPVTVKIQKPNQNLPYRDPKTAGYYTATLGLDTESASRIAALYEKHKLAGWNGFKNKIGETVPPDGAGFSLRIVFQSGEEMKAEGYEYWPDGYSEFATELDEILKPYSDRMMEEFEEIGTFEYLY